MDGAGRIQHALNPCTPHPATPLLHRIGEWSDRPHFATRAAYDTKVFPLVQPTAKVSPEQVFIYRARRPTGLFVYGRRGSMHHDLHFRSPGGSSYNVYAYHKSEYRNGRSNGSSAEEHAVLPGAGQGRKGRDQMANSQ